ncbi:hypothetical protein P152DRAFT_460790 [Eremomyces bilateralis CBS 781.70]|uniref:GPI anchored cell wall protein n=1 Tax=Eremomyces bilateralis CBS 781.70 TaxID=1392243 RepID=A0A6G1FX49_9PEZI|nr:uncharacterized protein P152DRAFT_460790 [Eremomyces bilateralis CBS 781.70]KAF1810282.1 hypothetical protein P152DRAFT_460790 [Eremomyces bilateralis CBS 781.70]
MKSFIVVALVALAQFAVATPPACILAAANTQDNPADVEGICKNKASEIQGNLASICGGQNDNAQSAFAAICKSAGVTVSPYVASSSGTSNGPSSGPTSTGSPTGSESANTGGTPTGSANPSDSTGAASRREFGSFAAVAIAAAGLIIAV